MHGAGSVVATMRITEIVIDVSCLVGCLCVFVWGDKEQERSCADVFFMLTGLQIVCCAYGCVRMVRVGSDILHDGDDGGINYEIGTSRSIPSPA